MLVRVFAFPLVVLVVAIAGFASMASTAPELGLLLLGILLVLTPIAVVRSLREPDRVKSDAERRQAAARVIRSER